MGEYDNAAAAYWLLVERFPEGAHAAEAALRLSDLYFDELRDFDSARAMSLRHRFRPHWSPARMPL